MYFKKGNAKFTALIFVCNIEIHCIPLNSKMLQTICKKLTWIALPIGEEKRNGLWFWHIKKDFHFKKLK